MKEIVLDLKAEREDLDRFLTTLADEMWDLSTPAEGWTVRDSVSHIAYFDDAAILLIRGDNSPLDAVKSADTFGDNNVIRAGLTMKPAELLSWFRQSGATMCDDLLKCDPKDRIPWFALPMGARSFATARLMETWAHGLDCYAAADVEPVDTDRLRHTARLAYMARPYAHQMNSLPEPAKPLRLELRLPSGTMWTHGPEDADDTVSGDAGDFCRVAVRRRHWKDSRLTVKGDEAGKFVEIAQTYAGPPGPGRMPGRRPAGDGG